MAVSREQLEADNAYFKAMLDLIPSHRYFGKDTREELRDERNKLMDEKYRDAKLGDRHELSDKAKLKRARFDPGQMRTVTQIHQELREEENNTVKYGETNFTLLKKKKKGNHEEKMFKNPLDHLEDLRIKLRTRLEELKAKRRGNMSNDEWVEKKRIKRRESKLKLKMKRKRNKKRTVPKENSETPVVKTKLDTTNHKPIFNKEGKVVFSKFDFSDGGKSEKKEGKSAGKNYKQLLQKAENNRKRLSDLREKDNSAADKLEEKQKWGAALEKVQGKKVKDNPELLKKSLNKKEKLKTKRRQDWEERKTKIDERLQTKQDKRKSNIKNKKQSKIDHKIKKAKKKGRVPGF